MWGKQRKKTLVPDAVTDAVARIVKDKMTDLQHAVVRLLQRWESCLTVQQKKVLLVFFCFVCGGYCCYLLGNVLFAKSETTVTRGMITLPVAKPPPSFFKNKRDTNTTQLFQNKKQ